MRRLIVWDPCWAPHAAEFTNRLSSKWQVLSNSGDPAWLLSQIADATALIATSLPSAARAKAPNLRAFLFPGAGVFQPDPSAYPAGCPVLNVFEHETPIAEYALMMMLAHVTHLRSTLESFRAGRWDGSGRVGGAPHGELDGQTVGLIGYGHIGQAIAARARAFGLRVVAAYKAGDGPPLAVTPDLALAPSDLETLLSQSAFLVIAAPLTAETRAMIGSAQLALLPPSAFLINVSRAEIVDEEPLFLALSSGRLAGAALDVWYQYPDPGQPGFGSRFPFHELPNVFCTPHYSAWSSGMILRRIEAMCRNLLRLADGQPLERVVLMGSWKP